MRKFAKLFLVLTLVCLCACVLFACSDKPDEVEADVTADIETSVGAMTEVRAVTVDKENKSIAVTVNYARTNFDFASITLPEKTTIAVYKDENKTEEVTGAVDIAVGQNKYFVTFTKGKVTLDYTVTVTREDHTHAFGDWTIKQAPTCTEKGIKKRACSICSLEENADVDPIGHDLQHHNAQDPTCTAVGWDAYDTCSRCSYTTYSEKAALGHAWSGWVIDNDSTCSQLGAMHRTCSECTAVEDDVIAKKPHTEVVDAAVPATCTETGLTAGKHCSVCSTVIVAQEVTNALGHDKTEWTAPVAPTCTENGNVGYYYCNRCHNYLDADENVIGNDPACVVVAATGHDWGEWIIDNDSTCTDTGTKHRVCSTCSALDDGVIAKKPHTEVVDAAVPATCTETGLTEGRHCSVCSTVIVAQQVTNALGHDIINHAAQAATCTAVGWEAYETCSRCDHSTYEEIPALGHDIVNHAAQAATCEDVGWNAYETCSRCDHNTYEEIPALGHNYVDNECTRCHDILLRRVDVDNNDAPSGDYVLFGKYPQSEVTDNAIKTALNDLAGDLPTVDNDQSWTAYDYRVNNNNEVHFMWYKDVKYEGEKYRGVYFTTYRPYNTVEGSAQQHANGYDVSTVYWFKFEPIKWRILSIDGTNKALILCESIIDSQEYYTKQSYGSKIQHNGGTGYANNYELSEIRKWLNDTFYNTAFTSYQKALIQLTTVDNSTDSNYGSYPDYACDNTQDNVFLLSFSDATNTDYGFSAEGNYEADRKKKTTDYAKSQAAFASTNETYLDNGNWWLRSPYNNQGSMVWFSQYNGMLFNCYANVTDVTKGVVPAVVIQL